MSDELLLTEKDLPWLYNFTVTKGNIDSVLEAQLAKVKRNDEQRKLEIENQTIKAVLAAIEKHGLDKVLTLRDKRRSAYSILADLSNPLEIRGKGKGV